MNKRTTSTRRSFLKSGAVLAAPLAAAAPAAILADDGLRARLAQLENRATIRELHQSWLRQIHARPGGAGEGAAFDAAVRSIAADHAGQPDAIELAADGRSAKGRFACVVEIETAIPADCTLAEMAHAQGDGFVRRTERRVLEVDYVKRGEGWAIAKAGLEPA